MKRVERGSRTISLENFMRIVEVLEVPLNNLLYENLNKIPTEERIQNVLSGKSEKQKGYLLHMLEEMAKGLNELS
jgi:hypothetical protein